MTTYLWFQEEMPPLWYKCHCRDGFHYIW